MSKPLTPLQALARWNGILTNQYALDNGLRAVAYFCGLLQIYLGSSLSTDFVGFLKDLTAKISDARFLNRFYIGLGASIEGYYAYSPSDMSVEAILGKIMAMSMIIYHPLEHGWWLTTLKPNVFTNIDGNLWSLWSCRMWLIYVICDLIGTLRKLGETDLAIQKNEENGGSAQNAKLLKQKRNLLIWLTCIAADFPLAYHWSVANGPFTNSQLTWAGFYGGVAGLYLRWLKASDAAAGA